MPLEDLSQYVSDQTAVINRLIGMGYFTSGPVSLAWTGFKDSVWKKGLGAFEVREPVERDDDPVKEYREEEEEEEEEKEEKEPAEGRDPTKDEQPTEDNGPVEDDYTVPTTALVAKIPDTVPNVWHSASQRILVRSDYLEAAQTALSASEDGRDVLLVTGQPGIGPLPSCSSIGRI